MSITDHPDARRALEEAQENVSRLNGAIMPEGDWDKYEQAVLSMLDALDRGDVTGVEGARQEMDLLLNRRARPATLDGVPRPERLRTASERLSRRLETLIAEQHQGGDQLKR